MFIARLNASKDSPYGPAWVREHATGLSTTWDCSHAMRRATGAELMIECIRLGWEDSQLTIERAEPKQCTGQPIMTPEEVCPNVTAAKAAAITR